MQPGRVAAAGPPGRRRAASGHVYDSYYLLQDGGLKVGYRRFRALLLLHYDVTRKRADTAEPPGVRFCLLPRGRLSSRCFLLGRPHTPRSSAYEAAFALEYRERPPSPSPSGFLLVLSSVGVWMPTPCDSESNWRRLARAPLLQPAAFCRLITWANFGRRVAP